MIISKDEFCNVMERIDNLYKLQDDINNLFKNYIDNRESDFCNAGSICISLETPLIRILDTMFTPERANNVYDIISWWVYETELGKRQDMTYVIESDGTKVDLSTADKLYDYLVKGLKN